MAAIVVRSALPFPLPFDTVCIEILMFHNVKGGLLI